MTHDESSASHVHESPATRIDTLKIILRNLIKPKQLIIRSYLQEFQFCILCQVFSW